MTSILENPSEQMADSCCFLLNHPLPMGPTDVNFCGKYFIYCTEFFDG